MKKTFVVFLLAIAGIFPLQALAAQSAADSTAGGQAVETVPTKGPATETVVQATQVFQDIMADPAQQIPKEILDNAEAIFIVPNLVKVAFIAAGRHGTGVLSRHTDQGWSPPVFASISGASIGAQLGAMATDVIMVLNNSENVQDILQGNDFTVGVDAAAAAGPLGAGVTASTKDAEIYTYKRTEGLFAGASLTGGVITLDQSATTSYYAIVPDQVSGYYGSESEMMQAITGAEPGRKKFLGQMPTSAEKLQAMLNRYTPKAKGAGADGAAAVPPPSEKQAAAEGPGAGAEGTAVYISPVSLAAIQYKLQDMGFNPGQPDGQWGQNSADAVARFQQSKGLAPTGNLNVETIQALDMPQVLKGAVERTGYVQASQIDAQQGAPLYLGPAVVESIQQLLSEKGFYDGKIDGSWGPATRKAIQAFESSVGLQPTSGHITVDLISSLGLQQHIAQLVGVGAPEVIVKDRKLQIFEEQQQQQPSQAQAPSREQADGSEPRGYFGGGENEGKGAPLYVGTQAIREIQQALQRQGYDPGSVDGIWGDKTQKALKEFQQSRSLEPTGNLNITTARILTGGLETQDIQPEGPQGGTNPSAPQEQK